MGKGEPLTEENVMVGVEPVTMDRSKARELWREYKLHCKSKHTAEDRGIMLGYRALAQGHSIIDLYDVFRNVPADAKGLPKLAIGRAHWINCHYDRDWPLHSAKFCQDRFRPSRDKHGFKLISIPSSVMPATASRYYTGNDGKNYQRRDGDGRAIVPIIPANIRPKASLERYHILWEADWDVVPRDPLLLRQLHGTLYAVLAQWDLTDLERMVLSHRLGS
jgi:hypothetical protein